MKNIYQLLIMWQSLSHKKSKKNIYLLLFLKFVLLLICLQDTIQ